MLETELKQLIAIDDLTDQIDKLSLLDKQYKIDIEQLYEKANSQNKKLQELKSLTQEFGSIKQIREYISSILDQNKNMKK